MARQLWFVTGSQALYGAPTLERVAADAQQIAASLNTGGALPLEVVWKPTVKTPEEIYRLCREANAEDACLGLILWMHTFSPAKMWIAGLTALKKPFVHLHTQFGREIPWASLDMDYMNLHQSAHGDREFGFLCTRLRKNRTVVVGHWEDPEVRRKLGRWARVAAAWHEAQHLKVARFGDNMRQVAVTEGDKVEAQIKFGFTVDGYGLGDLLAYIARASENDIAGLVAEYRRLYELRGAVEMESLREQARIELGLRAFLEACGAKAFTTTFEDLHGLRQLPGLAVQRLMADGFGFGAEGDWKTAAMTRLVKVMGEGLEGGTSFMEDYTYHLDPAGGRVLGAHMLEVCPSIAAGRPTLEVHPLGIGGKEAPARLVFTAAPGPAVNASLIDLGHRFRLLVNEVQTVTPEHDLPKLPVARALWIPQPNLSVAAEAWILAGGAHHTVYSQQVDLAALEIFSEMADIELVAIDAGTELRAFKKELRWNEAAYR